MYANGVVYMCLFPLSDTELSMYLIQLVQVSWIINCVHVIMLNICDICRQNTWINEIQTKIFHCIAMWNGITIFGSKVAWNIGLEAYTLYRNYLLYIYTQVLKMPAYPMQKHSLIWNIHVSYIILSAYCEHTEASVYCRVLLLQVTTVIYSA